MLTQQTEDLSLGMFGVGNHKHVAYVSLELYIEEHETAEQSVLGILYEVTNLSRCPCKHDTQFGTVHFKELPVLTATQRNRLMVECLAQRVGIVSVVGLQCLAERVTLRLEHQPGTVIVRQRLDERAGTAVGRNDKGKHGRVLLFATVHFCRLQFGSGT